ncbi:hypothetical protein ROJ8625_00930 [Roseivivax jejudonensis]|uniref:Uncharacterized protein n=1 Tax=Roseivivax jejudonensis TaxID=1529041 RepID=A0A1X6YJV4_9RHOB|nr:hypothetical protein [Roseivivax jejudonensis]SLN23256.1 hypothetical protein ROJ8625_00930 [Roseivivax jejudonensis]
MTPAEWLVYENQGATRNQPLSPRLVDALSFLPELGVQMRVFSGGQPGIGSGGQRVGSTRHDHGNAADVFFYRDGRRLNWANEADRPVFEQIVRQARQRGVTGFGAGEGYMRPGSMHIGFGSEAVWGAGGSGANAPGWLRTAYSGGAGTPQAPASSQNRPSRVGNDSGDTLAAATPPASLLEIPDMDTNKPLAGGLLGNWLTPDRRDRAVLALEGMTLNPNRGLMMAAADGLEDRRKTRRESDRAREARKQANRTIQYLNAQGEYGRQLAAAVSTGALEAGEAIKLAMTPAKDNRTSAIQNYEYARSQGYTGSFEDFQGGGSGTPTPYSDAAKLRADLDAGYITQEQYDAQIARADQGDESAPEASIRRIMDAYDVDRRTATGIVDGTLRVSRDPVDDTVIVTDLATRESYRPGMPEDTAPPAQDTQPRAEPGGGNQLSFPGSPGADASDAFGFEGMLKGSANAVSDFIGLGAPFEDVRETQSDFDVLSESLINDVASAYERQPPSWLLQNIRELTPQAGGFQGAGSAQSKLGALRRNFENELNITNEQLGRRLSPAERQKLLSRKTGLEAAIQKVDSYLGRFGGGESNETQSGVSWSVVE